MGSTHTFQTQPIQDCTPKLTPKSSTNSIISLSQSSASMSSQSTSISGRFISYEKDNMIIYIQPNNNNNQSQSWRVQLIPKYDTNEPYQTLQESSYVVFGICDSSLIDSGYKHKYYGYGYSVTYCHGFKFYSYSTSFKIGTEILIKYNKDRREISFWCDGKQKKRTIKIQHHPSLEYAITMKSYSDQYILQQI